jgi:hypothetical protein
MYSVIFELNKEYVVALCDKRGLPVRFSSEKEALEAANTLKLAKSTSYRVFQWSQK